MKNLILILALVSFAINTNAQKETDTLYKKGKVMMVQKTVVDSFPEILSSEEAKKYFEGEIIEKDKSLFVVNSFFPFVKEEIIIREAFKKGSKNNAVTEIPGEKKTFWWGIIFAISIFIWNISRAYSGHIYYLPKRKNFLSFQIILFLLVIASLIFVSSRGAESFFFVAFGAGIIGGLFLRPESSSSMGGTLGIILGLVASFILPEKQKFPFPTEISTNSLVGTIVLITISFTLSIFLFEKRRRKIKNIKEVQKMG